MRILYVLPADMVGGAERQGVVQIRGLMQLGIEVIVATGGPELPWLERQFAAAHVTDYVVIDPFPHLSTRKLSAGRRLREAAANARALISARRAVEKLAGEREVDAIVANTVHGWVTTGKILRRGARPVIWRAGTRLGTRAQRFGVGMVANVLGPSAVLPNCDALRRELEPLVPCPTHVVPNGIDLDRFDPATARPRFRQGLEGRPLVGIVTRPQPEKGMDLLAEVIEKLTRRVPAAQFLIAGDGYRRSEFEARFRHLGLEAHARFVGHVDDIESFYASCDVLILTSRSRSAEASSNALLEAMAMERPVVATRVCGLPEMIEDGRQGWLVGEADGDAFAERIAQLLADRGLRERMGKAGRQTVLRTYNEKQAIRQLADLLESVVSRPLPVAASRYAAVAESPRPVLVSPNGYRVEGLTLVQVAQLMGQLR